MAYLEWNDTFSVHIREFDDQHKQIITMINDLRDALGRSDNEDFAMDKIHELINYASTHFRAEERYMTQYDFPEYELHEEEHDRFIEEVLDFQKRLSRGDKTVLTNILTFLKDWLVRHILGTDRRYSGFFNEKGLN